MVSHDLHHAAALQLAEPSLALCRFMNEMSRLSDVSGRLADHHERNGLTVEEAATLEAWAGAAASFFELNTQVLARLSQVLEGIAA